MNWSDVPQWVQFLTYGLLIFAFMSFTAIILSRAGRSPYWAIFTIIPYFPVVLFWLFAYCKWPKADKVKG